MANPKQELRKRASVMATAMDRIKVKIKEHSRLHAQLERERKNALQKGGKARVEWNRKAQNWRDQQLVLSIAAAAIKFHPLVVEMRTSGLFTAEELVPIVERLHRSAGQMTDEIKKLTPLELVNIPTLAA